MRAWLSRAFASLFLLPGAAAAPPANAPVEPAVAMPENPDAPTLVVTGRRQATPGEVALFVDNVLAEPENDRVARWADRLCLSIAGLDDGRRDFFAGEIATVAERLNLDVAQRHCDPSVHIIFTAEPELLLARLARDRPAFFGVIPQAEQRPFRASRAPVRWLSFGQLRGPQGQLPIGFAAPPSRGEPERPVPGFRTTPSRLETGSRIDLQAMIVIVDTTRLAGISYRSLADYLSMVVLGNVRPDHGAIALPSILNLMDASGGSAGAATTELSQWDLSYLDGMYAGTWNVPAAQRIGVIRAAMRRRPD